MSRQIDDVMALCCKISESRQIQAAVQNSAKGAAAAGGGAFLGGLLGGPPGLFIGTYACVFDFLSLTNYDPLYFLTTEWRYNIIYKHVYGLFSEAMLTFFCNDV